MSEDATEPVGVAPDAKPKSSMTTSQVYMRSILDFGLLSSEEEVALANAMRSPDAAERERAKTRLLKSNLRLVMKIANEFLNRGLSKHDLISEGNFGLLAAIERFDPENGARFGTYSVWWIKRAMRRALARQARTVRIPLRSLERLYRLKRVERELSVELGRLPTEEELAERLNFSVRVVRRLRRAERFSTTSLDAVRGGDDDDRTLLDRIPDEQEAAPDVTCADEDALALLRGALNALEERERRVIELRFGLDGAGRRTFEEIAQVLQCTREWVRRVQENALKKLQAAYGEGDEK